MKVHLCGVRGSTPAPGSQFVRYGGHTSCLAVSADGSGPPSAPTLVLDAGTGIRQVTPLLQGRPFRGTILLTHLHWDHVQGLPFFGGGDRDDARVTLLLPAQHAPGPDDGDGAAGDGAAGDGAAGDGAAGGEAESVLAEMMSPPHFPIRPRELRGAWRFATVDPGHLGLHGDDGAAGGDGQQCGPPGQRFSVDIAEVPHKGGRTFGYRVGDGHSVLTYIPDHCPTALGPGPDGWGEYHRSALELAAGADVLVHDAHLFPEELAAEATFGHSAADYAVELGRRAGVGRVLLFHHRPDRTDEALDGVARRFAGGSVPVAVAAEGSVLEL